MPTLSRISYDHANMWSSAAARGSVDSRRSNIFGRLESVKAKLKDDWAAGRAGFMAIPEMKAELAAARKLAAAMQREFRTLIVVGIGGSDLGARALLAALHNKKSGFMAVRFIGANTDPDEIASLLEGIDWRKTAINVISKSGDTIEPMSTFLLLRDQLIRKVGHKKHVRHVVATTSSRGGTLRQIADREGYRTLPVPETIGGRFSVLTPVGLFPAACAGLDVAGLVAGLKAERDAFVSAPAAEYGPFVFAALQHDAASRDQRITVLMPYAAALKEMGAWFSQLWAESLGKKHDRRGQIVHRGFTPVASLGATDQHSHVQLFNEGPADKTVTFVEVGKFAAKLAVPKPYPDIEGVAYMGGLSFERIIHAERQATAQALAASGRPNGTITVPRLDAKAVGSLMGFFMIATAAAAELLDVNAYDQPGVEGGKRAMYALLGRKGY